MMSDLLQKENFLVGNEVAFGRYRQNADANEMTAIQWIVLARRGNQALLLSKNGLDAKPYHPDLGKVTWENSNVRNWLNTDFINAAFTKEEQGAILETKANNSRIEENAYDADGENDTVDKVFLLSGREKFEEYFSDAESGACKHTVYAEKRGAYENQTERIFQLVRMPGCFQNRATCVYGDGSNFNSYAHTTDICIRPALVVDLDSEIFESVAQK